MTIYIVGNETRDGFEDKEAQTEDDKQVVHIFTTVHDIILQPCSYIVYGMYMYMCTCWSCKIA